MPYLAFGAFGALLYFWFQRSNEGEPEPGSDDSQPEQPSADMLVTGYVNGVPRQMSVAPIGNGFFLRADAAQDFRKMNNACISDLGHALAVSTAFRSMEEQQRLYATLGPNVAAKPGYSNHQNGIAIDLHGLNPANANYDSALDDWLNEHSAEFGWKRTGLNFSHIEQWHLDYTG